MKQNASFFCSTNNHLTNSMKLILSVIAAASVVVAPMSAFAGGVNSRTFNEFSRGTYGEWGKTITQVDSQISETENYWYSGSSSALKIEKGHIDGLDVYIKNASNFSERGDGTRSELTNVSVKDVLKYDGYTRTYGIEAESGAGN